MSKFVFTLPNILTKDNFTLMCMAGDQRGEDLPGRAATLALRESASWAFSRASWAATRAGAALCGVGGFG